jgi:DNA polymerase-3 subunit gamma/tau
MTLYLKYRPKNLDEIDEVDVSETLKKIISQKSFPHAFLFAGPKGTGKTSAARILAKIINCENPNGIEPCSKCEQCLSIEKGNNLDVIELDAASHRGIDDVRVLKDAVKLAPVKASKKIYIIDEAHMLTTEASNALLKTLEEPPEHVVFILATTNPEKLIDTIRSRTTLIAFKRATINEISKSLKRVADGEKIKIDGSALTVIAEAAGGSFRDAIKILEQVSSEGKELTEESLRDYLFSKKDFDLDSFVSLLVKKDTKKLVTEIGKLGEKGVSIEVFLKSLLTKLRLSLLSKVGIGEDGIKELDKTDLINLIELLQEASNDIPESLIEELPLEMAVIKWCGGEETRQLESVHSVQNSSAGDSTGSGSSRSTTFADQNLTQTIAPDVHKLPTVGLGEEMVNDDVWKNILALVKPINASIEALLRSAKPLTYDGKVLTLAVYYKFHKDRLEDSHHRIILEDAVAKILNSPTKVVCTLVEPPPKAIIEETKVEAILTEGKDKDIIKAAEEIFSN